MFVLPTHAGRAAAGEASGEWASEPEPSADYDKTLLDHYDTTIKAELALLAVAKPVVREIGPPSLPYCFT